jgi:hypothetical protein
MNSTQAGQATFHFERRLELSESQYAQLRGRGLRRRTWKGWLLLVSLVALGIALMFSRWTAALGGLALLLAALLLASPWIDRWAPRKWYRDADYLHGATLHGVSDARLWFEGDSLRAESTWPGLKVWDIRHGYLMLFASGMPAVFLPENELRSAGIYNQILLLAQRHAVRFDSPEARGRMSNSNAT